mmetsp:Transcript_15268/g.20149  ORF Transcript_15268/g.20149 Transcript_15268/m.20149 type:complete len:225 (+) Transcript_15268:93-767(+)
MENLGRLTAKESEFLAEDEIIEIVPNFRHPTLNFINGEFGEFIPDVPLQVPLWLAVSLKKRGKCRIRRWPWMDKDILGIILRREQQDDNFTALPYHYMEMASLVFNCASDDIEDADRIRVLLEDIENVRMAKLRKGMNKIAEAAANTSDISQSVKLNNIGSLELLVIRGFFTEALEQMYVISGKQARNEEKAEGAGNTSGSGAQESTDNPDMQGGGARRIRRFR